MDTKMDEAERKRRQTMIAEEWAGIFPPHEAFYIQSIIYSADRAEAAFARYDAAVAAATSPDLVVATVQEALTHAAAISRFFWPMGSSDQAKARGKRLCAAFESDDASPIRPRKLRNAFEHFDEDLDRFLIEDPVGCFFPTPLVDDHELADDELGNIFKLVDPVHGICVLLGEKYDFANIRGEVRRILTKARHMSGSGGRLTAREDMTP